MPQPKRKEFPAFTQSSADWRRFKTNLYTYAGNTAVNFFQDSFRRKGFIDKGYIRWRDRQAPKRKAKARGTLLLVSGRLKNSIRMVETRENGILIATDVPYAGVHNDGSNKVVNVRPLMRTATRSIRVKSSNLKSKRTSTRTVKFNGSRHSVKGYSYKQNIPQRQFMGDSEFLMQRLEMHLFRSLDVFAKGIFN
jgi:phage gpG-like protein